MSIALWPPAFAELEASVAAMRDNICAMAVDAQPRLREFERTYPIWFKPGGQFFHPERSGADRFQLSYDRNGKLRIFDNQQRRMISEEEYKRLTGGD